MLIFIVFNNDFLIQPAKYKDQKYLKMPLFCIEPTIILISSATAKIKLITKAKFLISAKKLIFRNFTNKLETIKTKIVTTNQKEPK
jgi:hypothetical protein